MRLPFLLLLALLLLPALPVNAQDGPTESQEETLEAAPPETETYPSPFPDDPEVSADNKLMNLYVGPQNLETIGTDTRQLNVAHRTDDQLSVWLEDVIPQTLTYTNAGLNKQYAANAKLFTTNGLVAYRDYLSKSGLLPEMKDKKYRLNTVASQKPQLLNEGVANNLYKWLYDVTLMVTLLPEDAASLRKIAKQDTNSRQIVVRLQLTRTNDVKPTGNGVKDSGADVLIETWDVRPAQ